MYVARKWPAAVYDGTNSADVIRALVGMCQFVSEEDGVLTLTSTGEDRIHMAVGQVACEGQIWNRADFDTFFHVLPEGGVTP